MRAHAREYCESTDSGRYAATVKQTRLLLHLKMLFELAVAHHLRRLELRDLEYIHPCIVCIGQVVS